MIYRFMDMHTEPNGQEFAARGVGGELGTKHRPWLAQAAVPGKVCARVLPAGSAFPRRAIAPWGPWSPLAVQLCVVAIHEVVSK